MKRRKFIENSSLMGLTLGALPSSLNANLNEFINLARYTLADVPTAVRGKINHSVCHWCFDDIPLEEFLIMLNKLGIGSIDLVGPKDWQLLKKYNIFCSMCNGAELSLTQGWNNPKFHTELIANYKAMIPLVAEAKYTNLICFSGNRDGMSDAEGLSNCVTGLRQVLPLAEKYGVVLQMELFNQIDHPDYMCDRSDWGVALCKALGSDNFKLLFDIYHMQIQEGDIIRSIKKNHEYFGHYHTAGVPGRNEIDETQELYYPAIMRAIVQTGFNGHVAQEFIPSSRNPIESLKRAIEICEV